MPWSSSPPRGSNHGGMRQYNDRVILQLLRQHGALSKAELARKSGLTAQTLALITARLEAEGLLMREALVRGRPGQPSMPFSLNPEGAFALGLHIGRRETELVLTDFVGQIRQQCVLQYDFPDPQHLFIWLAQHTQQLSAMVPLTATIKGIGVAVPFVLEGWREWLGEEKGRSWAEINITQEVERATQLAAVSVRDTVAACAAELFKGHGQQHKNFLYLYVDTFVGGSWVFNSRLYYGAHGNGGAVASLPLHRAMPDDRTQDYTKNQPTNTPPLPSEKPAQLWRVASLWTLEKALIKADMDPRAMYSACILSPPFTDIVEQWIGTTANALAYLMTSATAFVDVGAVVIDGACAPELVAKIHRATEEALALYDWEGLWKPNVYQGHHHVKAPSLGGALLPLYDLFSLNPEVFIKEASE